MALYTRENIAGYSYGGQFYCHECLEPIGDIEPQNFVYWDSFEDGTYILGKCDDCDKFITVADRP